MQSYTEDVPPLAVSVALNIKNISDIHKVVLSSLSNNKETRLALDADAQVDLSFVQLMETARIFAEQQGKSLALASPAGGALLDVLRRGGFLDDLSPDAAKFWLHQETV